MTFADRSRSLVVGVIAATALATVGCSASDEPSADTVGVSTPQGTAADDESDDTAATPAASMRIGLVAPSEDDDLAWTQAMFESLQRVAAKQPIELDVSGGLVDVDDAADALRGYADDGFDLVIAHGTQYRGALDAVADAYPDVSFALGTSIDVSGRSNVFAYSVEAGQGGYVNGVIAAQLTDSDVIGVVAPVPAGDARSYVEGFELGVASENASAEVAVDYIDSFSDVQLAGESARAHVANGADVLTGTSQMVPGAIGVARDRGVPWLGTQSNQSAIGADVVVAAQVYDWAPVIEAMLDRIATGALGGETFVISLASGEVAMEYNDGFDLDPAIRASADAAVAGIIDGSIVVSSSG